MRGVEARVKPSELVGKVAVEADREGDARGTGEPGADTAERPDGVGKRAQRRKPPKTAAEIARSGLDCLEEPRDQVDLACGYQPKQRAGAEEIDRGDQRRRDVDRARQVAPRIAHLVPHRGRELETGEGERDRGPE